MQAKSKTKAREAGQAFYNSGFLAVDIHSIFL